MHLRRPGSAGMLLCSLLASMPASESDVGRLALTIASGKLVSKDILYQDDSAGLTMRMELLSRD